MKHTIEININEWQLFEMLCKELRMSCVLDTDRKFYIKNGMVCSMEDGIENVYDDRVNLFVALRNTLVQINPKIGNGLDNVSYIIG